MSNTDWAEELRRRKAKYEAATADLAAAKQHHRDLVVALTYDLPISEVSELSGWSVAYLRRLRTARKSKEGIMHSTTFTPQRLIHDATVGVDDAEATVERRRYDYIDYMREITQPALSMNDVAEVIGVSRQRVSQLLSTL